MIKIIKCLLLGALAVNFSAKADIVTDWNTLALDAIRTNRTNPPLASRALAILHIAIYDAVNGIKQSHEQRFQNYLVKRPTHPLASEEAAALSAAHLVLVDRFPAQAATFDGAYTSALALIPEATVKQALHKRRGVNVGEHVARTVLASRADDGSTNVVAAPVGTGPGAWLPTPPAFAAYLLPQWGFVEPFALDEPSQFRPPAPPRLASSRYASDYQEVKLFGAATGSIRTADQTQIATFWADGAGTATPPGHWNLIAQAVAAAQGNTFDENARLFALLNIAMADAAICSWDAKYEYNFWRPVTAIRAGDTDGNPNTDVDAAWSSFIGTPPFPDHTSGHSTFSGAAATVLGLFYETDAISFDTGSDGLAGVTRHFDSFLDAADEAARSRLYGGIHFRSANEDGLQAGISIGVWTFSNVLKAKSKPRD